MPLPHLLGLRAPWRPCFPQQRTDPRAVRQGLGGLVCIGRRTLSRIIWTNGGEQRCCSGEYFLHSRWSWQPQQLFAPIFERALALCHGRLAGVAIDETRLRKSGPQIRQAFYQRDPLSPPFHVSLLWGLRYLQASLLVPLHRNQTPSSARARPVRFECAPVPKRPGRRAGAEEREQYQLSRQQCRVSPRLAEMTAPLRAELDAAGGKHKSLLLSLDGSFCYRTVFWPRASAPRSSPVLARTPCCAAPARHRHGAFIRPPSSTPSSYAAAKRLAAARPRCFTAASAARFAARKLPACAGRAARGVAFVGCCAEALSPRPFQEALLPPASLSADDGLDEPSPRSAADLF